MKKDKVKRDGRVFSAFNVIEKRRYFIHPLYELEYIENAKLTSTGHLVIAYLRQSGKSVEKIPDFEFRWDEKIGELDIDPVKVSKSSHNDFKNSKNNCRGHHTKKLLAKPRFFSVGIAWYGQDIYRGEIGFSVRREVESKVNIVTAVSSIKIANLKNPNTKGSVNNS